jgi:hypothetical protein
VRGVWRQLAGFEPPVRCKDKAGLAVLETGANRLAESRCADRSRSNGERKRERNLGAEPKCKADRQRAASPIPRPTRFRTLVFRYKMDSLVIFE